MKIRNGFVSNSSSTSFTFLFKGNSYDDLFEKIKEHSSHFERHEEWANGEISWHSNAESVIQSIKDEIDKQSCLPQNKYISNHIFITKTEKKLEEIIEQIEAENQYQKEHPEFYKDSVCIPHDLWNLRFRLEQAIKSSLNSCCEIEFGDSHGITGSVGCAMDHQGRYIQLEMPDLVVVATSQH